MSEINVFEVASRKKYRFPFKGQISVEDLWDLSMKNLDEVYRTLSRDKNKTCEESLMEPNLEDVDLINKINIVKYIYTLKLNEQNEMIMEREKRQRDKKIMEIIERKENAAMENLSIEELKAMLNK